MQGSFSNFLKIGGVFICVCIYINTHSCTWTHM